MPIAPPIETQRLLVRFFDADADCMEMLAVYGDPDVMRFVPGGALADSEAVRALLQQYVEAQQIHGFSSWGLVERESGSLIGDVGFSVFEPTGDIEFGYTLAHAHWGNGYATAAASACLAALLPQLRTERIIAVVDEANRPSLRVADRLGMRGLRQDQRPRTTARPVRYAVSSNLSPVPAFGKTP